MIKILTSIVVSLVFVTLAYGQSPVRKAQVGPPAPRREVVTTPEVDRSKLKAQAEGLAKAFVNGDFDAVANLTFPDIIRLAGGRKQLAASVEKGMKGLRDQGFGLRSVAIGDPKQIIGVGKTVFAVVPTTMHLSVPEGTLIAESFFIGVSDDGGNVWTFIDGAGSVNKERLRMLLPSAADKLELPERKPPVLQKEPQR